MRVYEADITVEDPSRIILTGTPFEKGEKVHVTLQAESEVQRKKELSEKLKALFAAAAANPLYRNISEKEISDKIAAYRRGE